MAEPKSLKIPKWVQTQVSPYRFLHVSGVVKAAERLARRYHLPVSKAVTAAWLHDCAKELPKDHMCAWIKESPFRLDPLEQKLPELWHPHAGAAIAWKKWGIRDKAVLEAIRCHTLGSPDMKPLAQLIFVADFIEPKRQFEGVQEARQAALKSLRDGVCVKAGMTVRMLLKNKMRIHPRLLETWNAFLSSDKNEK
jgi:predicted HD superfamily hydrolase involved in NAD metabolism